MVTVLCVELADGSLESVDDGSTYIRNSGSQLLLTVTSVSDSGVYVCNATNNVGFDTTSAYLAVLGQHQTV